MKKVIAGLLFFLLAFTQAYAAGALQSAHAGLWHDPAAPNRLIDIQPNGSSAYMSHLSYGATKHWAILSFALGGASATGIEDQPLFPPGTLPHEPPIWYVDRVGFACAALRVERLSFRCGPSPYNPNVGVCMYFSDFVLNLQRMTPATSSCN